LEFSLIRAPDIRHVPHRDGVRRATQGTRGLKDGVQRLGISHEPAAGRRELPLGGGSSAVAIQDLIFKARLPAQQGDDFIDVVRGFSSWLDVACVEWGASSGSCVSFSQVLALLAASYVSLGASFFQLHGLSRP
jgi:hypothetical protein